MRLHFISGLPRAGTTLLAALLRQNPSIHTSIMSPTGQIVTDAVTSMGALNEARRFLTDEQRANIVRGIMNGYYGQLKYVIDNNRRWCANLGVLAQAYPASKVIMCVRPIPEIVNSFEHQFCKNALSPSAIHGGRANITVYDRTASLMSDGGVVGFAYRAAREAFYGPNRHMLIVLPYAALVERPAQVLKDLTERLGLPSWDYDLDHVTNLPGTDEFDCQLSSPGLHTIQPRVAPIASPMILPPDLARALPPAFWES